MPDPRIHMRNAPRPMRRLPAPGIWGSYNWPGENAAKELRGIVIAILCLVVFIVFAADLLNPIWKKNRTPASEPIHFAPPGPSDITARGDQMAGGVKAAYPAIGPEGAGSNPALPPDLEKNAMPELYHVAYVPWIELIGKNRAVFCLEGGQVQVDCAAHTVEYRGDVPQGDAERRVWRSIADGAQP